MKVILYMATSINGYITQGEDDSDWVSEIDWHIFDSLKRESKIMVMGARTYQQFANDFPQEGALNVVMTHDANLLKNEVPGALFTNKTPSEIIAFAQEKGFQQIMLIGGMTLNTAFQKDGLIDEIWLDVHPLLIGNGKTIFQGSDFIKEVQLVSFEALGGDQILLKYQVKK